MNSGIKDCFPNQKYLPLWIFFLALALRIGFYFVPRNLQPDSYIMMELADNFFKTGYQLYGEPHSKFLPFYPLLIALVHQIFQLNFVDSARLLNLVISSLMPVLLLSWYGKSSFGFLPGVLSALLFSFSGFDLLFSSYAENTTLLGFLTLSGFLLFKRNRIFFSGLVLGLAGLTRPEGLLALFCVILFLIKSWRKIAVLLFGYFLVNSPWLVWTWIKFGAPGATSYLFEFFFQEHTGLNFFSDLFRIVGPVALTLAVVGWFTLAKSDRLLTGLYFLFYAILHCWWWWGHYRFNAPLVWMLFLWAGGGIYYIFELIKKRKPRLSGLVWALLILALGEQLVLGVIFTKKTLATSPDPIMEAFEVLKKERTGKIISTKALLGKFEYGIDPMNLIKLKPELHPNQFVLEKVLKEDARWFIWSSDMLQQYDFFNFLSQGDDRKVVVEFQNQKYLLSYELDQVFKKADNFAYIYHLSVEKIKF